MSELKIIIEILGVVLLTIIILACPCLMIASIILKWAYTVKFLFLVLTLIDFLCLSLTLGWSCFVL